MTALGELDYGICPCGGTFENRLVEVRMMVSGRATTLLTVPQGVCPDCGSHVYKSDILKRIESVKSGKTVTEAH